TWLPVVRRSWGIVAEPSPAEEAESLAAELTASGQPAVAVPVGLLEPVTVPVAVTKAELSGDGFDILAGRAGVEVQRLVWTHMKVLSAGAVSETSRKTVTEGPSAGEKAVRLGATLVTGLPLMGGKSKSRQVSEERRIPFIEMIFLEPALHIRILASEFDYTALGTKMSYSAELNFRALVAELAACAPGALRGKGARAILVKAPSGELSYESFEDVSNEQRWLLTLAVLGAAQP
ncbi:MAG: hypothetical protein ABL955_11700, partial [Elusimicrobiota bacterium]